jgi:hypothetical protein
VLKLLCCQNSSHASSEQWCDQVLVVMPAALMRHTPPRHHAKSVFCTRACDERDKKLAVAGTACQSSSHATSASSETRPTENAKADPSQPSHVTHSTSTRRARSRLPLCPHSLARFRMYELLTYHPTVHEKMKSGVAAIGWGINPAFPDTRSFFCRLESGEIMSPRRAHSAFKTQSCIAQSAFETQPP